jgi:RNA polymerase sigma-70 factor (ECF subfamily)
MSEESSFAELLDGLRRGDEGAAQELFRRYAGRLIGLARSRLSDQLRGKVDPEDVMQSVFKSFFRRQAAAEYELDSWDSLWSLLTVITLRKCGYRTRHFRAARRDVRREQTVDAADAAADWQALAREPSPDEAAALTETVEQLLRGLDERERAIVELALQGLKAPEISPQVGVAERSVYRVLERVKGRLERLHENAHPR